MRRPPLRRRPNARIRMARASRKGITELRLFVSNAVRTLATSCRAISSKNIAASSIALGLLAVTASGVGISLAAPMTSNVDTAKSLPVHLQVVKPKMTPLLVKSSKAKDTARFPAGANRNANNRREEWLASDRTIMPGTPRAVAATLVATEYHWNTKQWACLDRLWWHESNWNSSAKNSAGAYGIPQALPASKLASAGKDWKTNPETQIRWGLNYIAHRYGNPCGALHFWGKKAAHNGVGWY